MNPRLVQTTPNLKSRFPASKCRVPSGPFLAWFTPLLLLIQRTRGSDQELYEENGYRHEEDTEVAKFLAAPRKPNAEDRWVSDDAQMLLDSLLRGKVVSRTFAVC